MRVRMRVLFIHTSCNAYSLHVGIQVVEHKPRPSDDELSLCSHFGHIFIISFVFLRQLRDIIVIFVINYIIFHDFLPTPRRGSHVKSGKTHTHSHQDTPISPYT